MEIVVPDDYPPTYASLDQPDLARLRPFGRVRLHTTRAVDRTELFNRIEPAESIINVRAYTTLDDEAFAHAPRLRMVSILGTGTDNVDLTAATRRGITVTNTPGVGAPSVAELTVGLMWERPRAARVRVPHERKRQCSYATLIPALSQREREISVRLLQKRPWRV